MKILSAWDISSKGLIFSKMFKESEYDLGLQKKALANILVTQDFDMMPVVEESATTIGSQTTTGPITGVAILDESKTSVNIIDYEDCQTIPRDTNFVSAIKALLLNKNRFVFVGESTSKAEAIITSSMLNSREISNGLILLSAAAAMEGKISEDAGFGVRVYQQILDALQEENISESCLNNLESLDPETKASGAVDSEVTYVPSGVVTAQHIMKFPLAGITQTMPEYVLAAKMLGQGNDFDNLLLYGKERKLPEPLFMINHETNHRSKCRTISYDKDLKSIIKSMKDLMKICVVRPNPDIIIRGEKMVWPAIISADVELQSDASLKELGKLCVEVELAEKRLHNVDLNDYDTTLGTLSPKVQNQINMNQRKINHKHKNSKKVDSTFSGTNSLVSARNALFHKVLGGYGKLNLHQMQNIVRVHDSLKPEIEKLKK